MLTVSVPRSSPSRLNDHLTFQVEIPFMEWIKCIPETVQYKDKVPPSGRGEDTTLRPGTWTHIMNDHIWKKVKNTCTFVFQRAKVYPTVHNNDIDIRGYCKECHGLMEWFVTKNLHEYVMKRLRCWNPYATKSR